MINISLSSMPDRHSNIARPPLEAARNHDERVPAVLPLGSPCAAQSAMTLLCRENRLAWQALLMAGDRAQPQRDGMDLFENDQLHGELILGEGQDLVG